VLQDEIQNKRQLFTLSLLGMDRSTWMIVLQCQKDVTSLEESIDRGIAHIWDEGVIIMEEKVTFKEIALGELSSFRDNRSQHMANNNWS